MKQILLTGFEPFGKWQVNPTQVAVEKLDGMQLPGCEVVGRVIPLRYQEIRPTITKYIEEIDPVAVIMTGQAGGNQIRLEQVAHNLADARIPYNCGSKPSEEILILNGSELHHSSLPLDRILEALKSMKIPVRYSDDAGRFGCNQIFYQVRELYPALPAGFIHVPLLPDQTEKKEFMEQDMITIAIETVVRTVATTMQLELHS